MKKAMTILLTILILYLLVIAFFYFMQSSFLFFPRPLTDEIKLDETTREVWIESGQDLLHGWLVKNKHEGPHKLIIYFGGNAEEVSHMISVAPLFEDWAVLLINYPGYGLSGGKPGEGSFFRAALAIYDHASSLPEIDNDNIVVMGRSIGTGSAVFLARERKAKAVILISPFESMRAVAKSGMPFLPVGLLLRHPFESKRCATHITSPLLAFYGTDDNIIPPVHTKNLVSYWKGPATLVELPGFGHNDIFESKQLWQKMDEWLRGINSNRE